jgi:hypothetical protein
MSPPRVTLLLVAPIVRYKVVTSCPVVAGVQDLSHVDRWGPPAESLGSTGSVVDRAEPVLPVPAGSAPFGSILSHSELCLRTSVLACVLVSLVTLIIAKLQRLASTLGFGAGSHQLLATPFTI